MRPIDGRRVSGSRSPGTDRLLSRSKTNQVSRVRTRAVGTSVQESASDGSSRSEEEITLLQVVGAHGRRIGRASTVWAETAILRNVRNSNILGK